MIVRFPPGNISVDMQRLSSVLCLFFACVCLHFGAGCQQSQPGPAAQASVTEIASVKDDKMLSLAQRKFLWDVEHLAFVVEEQVFRPLADSLAGARWEGIRELCHADFTGDWPATIEYEEFASDAVIVRRAAFSGAGKSPARTKIPADGFVKGLQEYRSMFGDDPKSCRSSLGLVRFGPTNRERFDDPWRSTWKLRMAGQRQGRPVEVVVQLSLEMDAPSEDMGRRRGWLRSVTLDSVQVCESDRTLMRDITAASGIDTSTMHDNWKSGNFKINTGGVFLSDFNGDGADDALVLNEATGATLYRGDGRGKFVDVTDEAGLPRHDPDQAHFSAASCWADFDSDADEDLILFDRLWENLGNGTFRDVSAQSNLLLGPAAGYALADYDRDGLVDLYVCHSDQYMVGQRRLERTAWVDGGSGIDNVLWYNRGNWQFEDVTWQTKTGGGGLSCFAAVWFDANGDARPDLLAINEFGKNALLIQQPDGVFTGGDIDPIFGGLSMGVTTGDVDDDGNTDVYVANMFSKAGNRIFANVDPVGYPAELLAKVRDSTTGSKLYRSLGNGDFEVVKGSDDVAQVGWAYGTNFADFDADGRLDIYATAGFRSIQRGKPDG